MAEVKDVCDLIESHIKMLEEKLSEGKEYVLDRESTDILYGKLESKENLIMQLEAEIESLKSEANFESVNEQDNRSVALGDEIKLKDSKIIELKEQVEKLEKESLEYLNKISEKDSKISELESKINNVSKEGVANVNDIEIKVKQINALEKLLSECKEQCNSKDEMIVELESSIKDLESTVAKKTELVKEKIDQLEAMKLEFGSIIKLREELEEEKSTNAELREIQKELEDSINDYEHRLSKSRESVTKEESEALDLKDIFPIISDNSVLNARKIGYIREIGENPWMEDVLCYLMAILKKDLMDTGIDPYFVILDDLSSDIHCMKYKDYDFTLNALPSFGPAPESNITVTSFTSIPDLKAHLNISNHEFIIFIDRYGKSKPYIKRRGVVEYNLVNNSELVRLCKIPMDESLMTTFAAQNLENCVELPTDFSLRGKRDRISLLLQKKSFSSVIENFQAGLFK